MRQTLHIRLLGDFAMRYGEHPVTGVNTPRLRSLLAYLLLHRSQPLLRQQVAFLFWPDQSEAQARNNLRQMLHTLRLALPDADTFVRADARVLEWRDDAPYRLDVAELVSALDLAESLQGRITDARLKTALEHVVRLYQADLLPSCYDDWINPEREHLRQRYLRALEQLLVLLYEQGNDDAAIPLARRLVQDDPLNEDASRHLMRLLARQGDRAGALRVYHQFATVMQRELGIAPSAQTQDVYNQVLHTEAAPAPAREREVTRSAASRLIGRQREWAALREVWQRARERGPEFALISGEAGIGKSRLADELVRWARQHGGTVARARCYAAEGRLSLAPVTEWLRSEQVRPHLTNLDPLWLAEVARLVPELLTDRPSVPRAEPIGEYGQRQRFFEGLARGVLCVPEPLVLSIDDLQWCDPETLEWVRYLLRFAADAPLLVVGTVRSDEVLPQNPLSDLLPQLGRTLRVTEIALRPLDASETAMLAGQICGRELSVPAAMRLYRETEGNPLFVVESARAGLEYPPPRDSVSASAQGEVASPEEEHLLSPMPPRVHAVIAARLAQLSLPSRELVAWAATIGREFKLDVLAGATQMDENSLVPALDELWRRRIIREQGTNAYDFTHDKLREVAYAEISTPQRRLFHRQVARALEAVYARDLDSVSGEIASHYEQAGSLAEAVVYARRAAAVAQRVYANEDAIRLLTHALELLGRQPASTARDATELEMQLALAPIYLVARGWTSPELERAVERSLALCDVVSDEETWRVDTLCLLQAVRVVQGRLTRVLDIEDEMRPLLERTHRGVPPLAGMSTTGARFHLGQLETANSLFESIISSPGPGDDLDPVPGWNYGIHNRAWKAHVMWCLGYPDQALLLGREALHLARSRSQPFNEALASTYLAMLEQLCVEPADAKRRADDALAMTVEYQAPYYQAWAAILARYAEAHEHPDTEHVERLRDAIDTFRATGARLRLPYYLWLLASVCGQAHLGWEALAVVDEALAVSRGTDEHWWDAELHRLRGELMLAEHMDADAACAWLLRAIEIAREQHARSLELRASVSFARLWSTQGRLAEAGRLLHDVYSCFSEGYETPDMRAAHALLTELS